MGVACGGSDEGVRTLKKGIKKIFSMANTTKLFLIKLLHTVIWVFFVAVIGYIVYAGITGELNAFVWAAIGLIALEGVVLLFNSGACPLTPWAARYTAQREDNFDIFLPLWLARHNKAIFTPITVLGVLLIVGRMIF